ncbi:multifunctional transcriptional regulator/nicotinamide-nucleotide adenylyltransferase/ribosylnicotinamide kinase NadR [Psychrobacter okhotskensis]|uniref:multifunctional transcriptional regulator/nicotinamide-nucleotide adenylyltransferase/ribosylnicotinamide kinase NadR n=1 Tax=Psychrobacter okhotskensis TaxID=212403 RepID=UPI001564D41F|nr:multifunctional transcriptional regulator/nicotinamide-nucleotide adenylyltransferase/ribosylnicotinamide kinase NadR [Psychrobacter okhotskensis]NRD69071.1 multifunctional transcriptional regulator/nicotinamide-nucleotide adenylyltransferase/ribosylnicotinamide kinase NadR [Psychrobacter okhotskensis]
MYETGLMIGHFEPLHLGQMRSILEAAGQAKTLHIVIMTHPSPHPHFTITLQDKARWLQMACADLPFIHIHTTDQIELPLHEHVADAHIDVAVSNAKLQRLAEALALPEKTVLFVADNHPLAASNLQEQLQMQVVTTSLQPEFDSFAIARNPVAYWSALHPQARGDYTKTVAIVGGESSGKTTLVHKLANYYGASFALEMGRLYVGTDLGGSETGLQYSDYGPISLNHAQAIREAAAEATAPVTIVDTDFVTTQAFCEEYEGRRHPFVAACIDEFRLDHTIMLDNNTPWVDDGMRSLGTPEARGRFEQRLVDIFARHDIKPHMVEQPDYDARYQQALLYIDQHIYGKKP